MPSILNATTTNGLVTSADNSGSLQLQTNNGTTAVTIDTSQNVGIGTASPTQKLDVNGTAKATTLQTATLNSSSGVLATQNGMTGIAKAWVNFNGTGTVAIRDSFNVSSITDNGTGDYTVNFTTAMPNANYAFAGSGVNEAINTNVVTASTTARTTSALRIIVCLPNNSVGDASIVNVVVFSS